MVPQIKSFSQSGKSSISNSSESVQRFRNCLDFNVEQSDAELGINADDTFIYMRGYPSKAERDKRLKAAHDDPEFEEVVLKQERDPNARLIIKAHNIDMHPNGPYAAIRIAE